MIWDTIMLIITIMIKQISTVYSGEVNTYTPYTATFGQNKWREDQEGLQKKIFRVIFYQTPAAGWWGC